MKKSILIIVLIAMSFGLKAQNTSPLPAGTTTIGGHLSAGAGNEVWSKASSLVFNYGGNAAVTHFWNLKGSKGRSVLTLKSDGNVIIPGKATINGVTKIGGHLGVGAGNEVWSSASELFFNYGGNASVTYFWNLGGKSGKPIMTLKKDGTVGIGTKHTFGYQLAVNGVIGAKEIKVETTSAWPDYVFASDYNLRSLNEVETYIEQNNHLPDIPSQKEVNEKGINLGNMDAKLLQKIEELTLYIIQQNKKIENMQKQINELKK